MLRLPRLAAVYPRTLAEAMRALADAGPEGKLLSGGTDLIPKLKRRQIKAETLISLQNVKGLAGITRVKGGLRLGAGTRLCDLAASPLLKKFRGLRQAAGSVATAQIRNMATVGGNVLVDTRCSYYDRSEEWRSALGGCMKTDSESPCRVAPGSKRCLAFSSGDLPPILIALGARAVLESFEGGREIPLEELYADDGMNYLKTRPGEILTAILLEEKRPESAYLKLRRRGVFDFSSLGAAAAISRTGGIVRDCRIVLGAIASKPVIAERAAEILKGERLSVELIEAAAETAMRSAKPVGNADFPAAYRRQMVKVFVRRTLKSLLD